MVHEELRPRLTRYSQGPKQPFSPEDTQKGTPPSKDAFLTPRVWLYAFLAALACLEIGRSYHADRMVKTVAYPDLYEASISEIQVGLDAGHFTSVDLVKVKHQVPSTCNMPCHLQLSPY